MADKPKVQDIQTPQEVQEEQPAQDDARAKRLAAFRAALDPNSSEYRPDLAQAIKQAAKASQSIAAKVAANSDIIKAESAEIQDSLNRAAEFWHELKTLEPFIIAELAKDPDGTTWEFLINTCTVAELAELAKDPGSAFAKALKTARLIGNQQSKRPRDQYIPTAKLNTLVFADWLNVEKELHGQISMFPVKMEPDKYDGEITLYYDVLYPEELPDTQKKLLPFDRRINNSIYNLQRVNGPYMTFAQVFKNAGLGDKPTEKQLERVKQSVDKQRKTTIKWDNKEEATAYNKQSTYMEYDGYLCPVEIVTERKCFNGKPVEGYIHTLKPMPLMEFANERKQISQVPNYVLALPKGVNATDLNIALIDYVAARIVRAKRENATSVRILYNTLYKNIDATTRQKQRTAQANLFVYLEELKTKKYIAAYQEETTKSTGKVGVTISLPNN